MPGIRYQSRLMDLFPANAVVFLSVPNAEASSRMRRSFSRLKCGVAARMNDEKVSELIDRSAEISEYIGEEFVIAGVRSGSKMTAVAIADVIARDCGVSRRPRQSEERRKQSPNRRRETNRSDRVKTESCWSQFETIELSSE